MVTRSALPGSNPCLSCYSLHTNPYRVMAVASFVVVLKMVSLRSSGWDAPQSERACHAMIQSLKSL